MERSTKRPFGRADFAPSWIGNNICTATVRGSSNSISTCRKTSSASAYFNELINLTRIGNCSLADAEERKVWSRYMSAFEQCLSATSTREAPWYVVPADDKENARLIVSQIILDTLNGLAMTYPEVSAQRQ